MNRIPPPPRGLLTTGRGIAAALLIAAWGGPASAAEPCASFFDGTVAGSSFQATQVFAVLRSQVSGAGCVLGARDDTGIAPLYQKLFSQTLPAEARAAARAELLTLVAGRFAGRPAVVCEGSGTPECVVGRQAQQLELLRETLMFGNPDPTSDLMRMDSWAVQPGGKIAISVVNLAELTTAGCSAGLDTAGCRDSVFLAAEVMRSSIAMQQVIGAFNLPVIDTHRAWLSQRDREWDSYFNEVSVQYPWELAFNAARFQRNTSREERALFPRAPSSKWILAHPSLGFEYGDTPDNGNQISAAAVIEAVGYERWSWRNGRAANRWGVSAILSIADAPGMDTVGYGAMLRTPIRNSAIGLVWRDGDEGSEIGVIVNVDLARLLQAFGQDDLDAFLQGDQ